MNLAAPYPHSRTENVWAAQRLAAAVLAVVVAWCLWNPPARAAGRPFATFIVLGLAQPLQTGEGRYTPIVVVDHESPGWYGEGRLNASIYTSTLSAGMTHPVAERLALGYSARLRLTTEGDSADLYREGDRDSAAEFAGNSLAAMARATVFPDDPWRVVLELERMETRFTAVDNTRAGYDLPANFSQNEGRLSLSHHGVFGAGTAEAETEGGLTGAVGSREGWEDWSLDPDSGARKTYAKWMLHHTQPISWQGGSQSKLEGWLLTVDHLDVFSGYALGGLTGNFPVGGYFRNEFRSQRAAILNTQHEHRFSQHRRLTFFAHGARAETLATDIGGKNEWVSLASLGVGYYHGIEALHGLPIIVRYAEGVLIPAGSREVQRREILLVMAAGF